MKVECHPVVAAYNLRKVMKTKDPVPFSARALYPPSYKGGIMINKAFHPTKSSHNKPEKNGSDGWCTVQLRCTRRSLEMLREKGYTHVNLVATGARVARPFHDAPINSLLS